MDILEVKKLNKGFKNFALKDISFTLPAGYIMGYVGENGAGKTTTLNLITHLLHAETGEIRIGGITYEEDPIAFKNSIGFIGDESFFPQEFNLKNVRSTLKDFYPNFQVKKFNDLVKRWKLPENKKIGEYSKGMKVKLMFADVFSRDTKLLILDEATNGLDPVVRDEVLSLLQEYISDGDKSILFSTHVMSDLEQIADYIFFIHNGKQVMFDAKDDIIDNYVVIKGGNSDLTEEFKKNLIGVMKTNIGFSGLLSSDKAVFLSKAYLIEKPTIDQIVVHFIRNMSER